MVTGAMPNQNIHTQPQGFGDALYYGSGFADKLMHVELAFVPRDTCNASYGGEVTERMMCAADPGQDTW